MRAVAGSGICVLLLLAGCTAPDDPPTESPAPPDGPDPSVDESYRTTYEFAWTGRLDPGVCVPTGIASCRIVYGQVDAGKVALVDGMLEADGVATLAWDRDLPLGMRLLVGPAFCHAHCAMFTWNETTGEAPLTLWFGMGEAHGIGMFVQVDDPGPDEAFLLASEGLEFTLSVSVDLACSMPCDTAPGDALRDM